MAQGKRGPVLNMRMDVDVPNAGRLVEGLGADRRGRVQQLVTDEVMRRIGKYMPHRSGALEGRKTRADSPSSIVTQGPYARYVFFGVSPSGKPLSYDRTSNPLAGPHWDRRMVAAEGKSIVRAVRRKIEKEG